MAIQPIIKRPKRTPLGARNRLSFTEQDPNFVYRVINDTDDRLKLAQEAGYEFVESDSPLGDKRAGEASAPDSRVSKPVGNNTRGFLMRIPKEYYNADQKVKMDAVDETEKTMNPKYSKIEKSYGEGLTNT
jgi:hypothetical protein